MKKISLIFLLGLNLVFAQKLKVSADKTTVMQNERFQIYYEFEVENLNEIRNFKPPVFNGLQVLSGPNQSSSMQIINGQVSASITFSFIVFAPNPGKYTVGPALIKYMGKEFTSASLTITVEKGNPKTQNQVTNKKEYGVSHEEIAKNVFIVASADKSTVYKGEQVTVTYKLYTKLDISSPQITKLPTYKDFWAEEIETGNNIQLNIEMYKGERYRTAILKKVALFPTATGTLSVTPFELTIPVIITKKRSSRDIFDDFFDDPFFQRRETVEFLARSNKLNIFVKDLPQGNVPKSFNGAVGNYQVNVSVSKSEVEANESITYKLNVSGTGNIKLLELPEITFPASFDKYDPKVSESINNKGQISGSKTAEYLIIPRSSGTLKINKTEFSYFNPMKKSYVVIEIPEKIITVKGGKINEQAYAENISKEDIKLLSQDIRYIKLNDPEFTRKEDVKTLSSWFFIGIIVPALIFGGVIFYVRKNEKLESNTMLFKSLKAEKVARKKLKEAEKAIGLNNHFKFYDEISKALQGYLEDKLGIETAEFTKENVTAILREKNISSQLIDEVNEILSTCEYVKYSPAVEKSIYSEFYQRTIKLVIDLENIIGGKQK